MSKRDTKLQRDKKYPKKETKLLKKDTKYQKKK